MRWFKAAGGLLAIVLLMTSCLRVDGEVVIEDDGSGRVNFLSALNTDSLTSVLGDFDIPEAELGDAGELCDGFASEFGDTDGLPAGATVTPYDEDGFCGARVMYDLTPSLDHSAEIADVLDPSARIYKEGDNWFFESDFNADEITSEAADAPAAMFDALFADASFVVTIDLPGRAIDGQNNATEVGGDGRFTWDIDILNPPSRLFAQTEPGSGGGSGGGGGINPILIGVVLALLAAGLAFFLLNQRKKRDTDSSDTNSFDTMQPGDSGPGPAMPPTGAAGAAAQPAAMPFVDGPAITATPPGAAAAPLIPAADALKETVVIQPADIQQSIEAAATAAPTDAAAAPEPVFDHALNAWVVDDPTRGRLRHDPATDTWNPV